MISVHRPPARVDTRGYKITADKIVMGDTMKIEEGLNITVNPINSFGQRIENPREMVKLVDKGEQRLQILTKAPRTLYEKETQKIPGEDTNNMNSGGSAIKYKGLKSGGFYNMDNEVKKHLEEHERLKKIYDGGGLTLTEAKLRKPVDIDKMTLMRDQPAININDTEYTMLDELTFKQQEDVLGTSRYFKEPEPVISLIDVPEGGYNFRDMLPPRMRKMNKQDLLQEL